VGTRPREQASYPAHWLHCSECQLVQLGLVVDPKILFSAEYPYTSSTTKILRDNFAELYEESSRILQIGKDDLVVDIGSNDGNLLSNFVGRHRVLGITPEDVGQTAVKRGVPTLFSYFHADAVKQVLKEHGRAKIVTATNVFAHIEDVNSIVEAILDLLGEDGVFISESHYLASLIETLQYDTIYHEHLRYYSLHSLQHLLQRHGLDVFHAKRIPTHGGSIRVYASRKGKRPRRTTVDEILAEEERTVIGKERLLSFKDRVALAKLELNACLFDIKQRGKRVYGISAPSRASTLIHYTGLDDAIIDCVVEVNGSHKIGKYIPGTLIPIKEETALFVDQPDYALLLSWHIADELIPKLKAKGFKGDFVVPLPRPRIVNS
jgi:SAM-dependent methyltransferase